MPIEILLTLKKVVHNSEQSIFIYSTHDLNQNVQINFNGGSTSYLDLKKDRRNTYVPENCLFIK